MSGSILRRLGAGAAVAAAALAVAPAAHAAITNGSFEDGVVGDASGGFITLSAGSTEIPGWTVTANTVDWLDGLFPAADGDRAIDLNGTEEASRGAIEQSLVTTAGTTYTVRFALSHNNGCGEPSSTVRVGADSASTDYLATLPAGTYEEKSFEFTADDSSATLSFASQTPSCGGPIIDDVRVTETVPDADGDGFPDATDRCPTQAGTARGCPVPASTTVDVVRDADTFRAKLAGENPYNPFPGSFRYSRNDTRTPAVPTFEFGPASPPFGKGSYHLLTSNAVAKGQIASNRPAGDRLASLTQLTYWNYIVQRGSDNPTQAPAINIQIDFNGSESGGFATLVYEPVYQPGGGVPVETGAWRQRDAVDGGQAQYWSTRDIGGQPAGAVPANFRSLDQIVASNPNATIDFVAINQGSGNPGLDSFVDGLRIQSGNKDVTADLEPDNTVETYAPGKVAPVYTSQPLDLARAYTVTVKGTASVYARTLMNKTTRGWTLCGTTEANPLFPTPNNANGPTGFDPEYVFAFPQQGAKCNPKNAPLPRRQSSLRFSQGGGAYVVPTPAAPLTGIDAGHVYTYQVTGDGGPLKIKLQDTSFADNYGRFQVEIEPAGPPTA